MRKWINHCCSAIILLGLFAAGCATPAVTRPAGPPQPTKAKFAQFKTVEMTPVQISPALAVIPANQEAANKLNEGLRARLRAIFPNLKFVEAKAPPTKSETPVLRIELGIKDLKFVSGKAHFWAAPWTNRPEPAILMQATYTDMATGEVIANPEFFVPGKVEAGPFSSDATDEPMLNRVADDIARYTNQNR